MMNKPTELAKHAALKVTYLKCFAIEFHVCQQQRHILKGVHHVVKKILSKNDQQQLYIIAVKANRLTKDDQGFVKILWDLVSYTINKIIPSAN